MIVISRGPGPAVPGRGQKCVSGRPRGPAPPVVVAGPVRHPHPVDPGRRGRAGATPARPGPGTRRWSSRWPCSRPSRARRGPGRADRRPEARGHRPVVRPGRPADACRSTRSCPASSTGSPTRRANSPGSAPEFLAALHECGRTAAREATRFALDRVQVRGRAGQVVGTDGRQALLWGGFRLPFADDVLVPAVPVFGAPELAGQPDVRVGRTASHLVVAAGPWAVWLPADTGRPVPGRGRGRPPAAVTERRRDRRPRRRGPARRPARAAGGRRRRTAR